MRTVTMGVFTRIVVVGLMALCHIANGAVIPIAKSQELAKDTSIQAKHAPISTVITASETVNLPSMSLQALSASTTVYHHSPLSTRSTRSTKHATTSSSHSSLHSTRTTSHVTPYSHSPVMTEIPRGYEAPLNPEEFEYAEGPGSLWSLQQDSFSDEYDDAELFPRDYDDGYGYGSDSSTTEAVNGGYGSPPEVTDLPPGGYGNHPPFTVEKSSVVTVSDPVTVTVSLELYTSTATQSTPAIAAPIIVTETVTDTPALHSTVQNVTVTVTASKSTSTHSLSTTVTVSTGTTLSTQGYVYTTVTASSSSSHTASSTSSIVYTPTGLPPPKPFTNTNASESCAKFNWLVLLVAAAFAIDPFMSFACTALAILVETERQWQAYILPVYTKGNASEDNMQREAAMDPATDGNFDQCEGSKSCYCGCANDKTEIVLQMEPGLDV
ncbi:hypothetical protein F4776DRAFT_606873 [Hypoxylon sp. NC0597]|nr:hypothetical protein F4776DRAFT_606873 [Hypoxylon sp. NC0597]